MDHLIGFCVKYKTIRCMLQALLQSAHSDSDVVAVQLVSTSSSVQLTH